MVPGTRQIGLEESLRTAAPSSWSCRSHSERQARGSVGMCSDGDIQGTRAVVLREENPLIRGDGGDLNRREGDGRPGRRHRAASCCHSRRSHQDGRSPRGATHGEVESTESSSSNGSPGRSTAIRVPALEERRLAYAGYAAHIHQPRLGGLPAERRGATNQERLASGRLPFQQGGTGRGPSGT